MKAKEAAKNQPKEEGKEEVKKPGGPPDLASMTMAE